MAVRTAYTIVLAAGKGKRMKSQLPKVLHKLAGKCLIDWVLDTVAQLPVERTIVVVGHGGEQVRAHIAGRADFENIHFAVQSELLGTADAVGRAMPYLPDEGSLFVLCGDVPMLRAETLKKLLALHNDTSAAATILTAIVNDPTGYGRIIRRDDGSVLKIVEHRDASPEERKVNEINTGTYVFQIPTLRKALKFIDNRNVQGEFYLTDTIHIIRSWNLTVSAMSVGDHWEVEGINSPRQLADMEKHILKGENS